MEDNSIVRGRGRPRKTKGQTIKDINLNDLPIEMIHDMIL